MSDRRRRYSITEVRHREPRIEERAPEPEVGTITFRRRLRKLTPHWKIISPLKYRRRTVIFETTIHRRHKERTRRIERSRSPVEHRRRGRSQTPPPRTRLPSPPPLLTRFTMSPRNTPAPKATYVPLPKALPTKEEEDKAAKRDKKYRDAKDKVYPKGHKKHPSVDTGYGSGTASPYSVVERSPLDYSPKSARPKSVDKEVYEIINDERRKVKFYPTSKDRRVVSRNPDSPHEEEEYVNYPFRETEPDKYKDRYKDVKKQTKILQDVLAETTDANRYNFEAAQREESARVSQIEDLQAQLRGMRLSQQVAEGRAKEAEKRLKQTQMQVKINELERQERKLQEQQADALEERERELKRKEELLKQKQWNEIEASPSPGARRRPTLPVSIEQRERPRPNTTVATYGSTTVAAPLPSILSQVPQMFIDPILEAQRDEDARRARESEDRRRGIPVKERTRGTAYASKPRRDDRWD